MRAPVMRAMLSELVGLFVDDGFLAVALLAWCAAVFALRRLEPTLPLLGPLLLAGCAAILLATILRAVRPERGASPRRETTGSTLNRNAG